jgi:hypothetical protein
LDDGQQLFPLSSESVLAAAPAAFRKNRFPRAVAAMCRGGAFGSSAENSQPWRFFIVDDPACKDTLAQKALCVFLPTAGRQLHRFVVLCLQTDSIAKRMASKWQEPPFP